MGGNTDVQGVCVVVVVIGFLQPQGPPQSSSSSMGVGYGILVVVPLPPLQASTVQIARGAASGSPAHWRITALESDTNTAKTRVDFML